MKLFYLVAALIFVLLGFIWNGPLPPDVNGVQFEERGIFRCQIGTKSNPWHIMRGHFYTSGFYAPYGLIGLCSDGSNNVGKVVIVKWVNTPASNVRYILSVKEAHSGEIYDDEIKQRKKVFDFYSEMKFYRIIFRVLSFVFFISFIVTLRKKRVP